MGRLSKGFFDLLQRVTLQRVEIFGADSANMADVADREPTATLSRAHVASSLLDPQPELGAWQESWIDFFQGLTPEMPMRRKDEAEDGERHMVMIDIDHPAYLVESSTGGHFHLYIDVPNGVPAERYFDMLDAMAHAGVVQQGYAEVSRVRGYTSLRLPWIKKVKDQEKIDKANQAASSTEPPL